MKISKVILFTIGILVVNNVNCMQLGGVRPSIFRLTGLSMSGFGLGKFPINLQRSNRFGTFLNLSFDKRVSLLDKLASHAKNGPLVKDLAALEMMKLSDEERSMLEVVKAILWRPEKEMIQKDAQKIRLDDKVLDKMQEYEGHWSALHQAVYEGNSKMVQLLLRDKADPNIQTEYGNTPLHLAVLNRHPQIVSLLIDHGADLEIKNKENDTPLSLAKAKAYWRLLLVHRGCF